MTYTVAEHIAIEGMAPFELAGEVTLASGKTIRGSIARVYSLLRGTAEQRMEHRIGSKIGPAGWVPGYYIRKAWSGGNAGDRRLRDLRQLGVEIEKEQFGQGTDEESNTYLYRWVSDPEPEGAIRTPEASSRNLPIGSTLANGQFFSPSATLRTPSAAIVAPAPDRLRYFTCLGHPGSGLAPKPQNLAPQYQHPLAPTDRLLQGRLRGALTADQARGLFREELAIRWQRGEMRDWLREHEGKVVTLWFGPELADLFNPFDVLVPVLAKCGAEHLGDYREHAGQAVGVA